MHPDEALRLIGRLDAILQATRFQTSGSDIHTIGNIQNTATLLKDQLEQDPYCLERNLAENICKNTEKKLVEFYRKKYYR